MNDVGTSTYLQAANNVRGFRVESLLKGTE